MTNTTISDFGSGGIKPQGRHSENEPLIGSIHDSIKLERKVKKGWSEKAKRKWGKLFEESNEKKLNSTQKILDEFGHKIEDTLKKSPVGKFKSEWLDKTANGKWYKQLGDFLIKLPFRVVFNLVNIIYSIIKGTAYAFVHPIKAVQKFGEHIIDFANQMTKPVTWTKIGSGILGASVGASLISGSPIAVIGLGVGGALILGGVVSGIIKELVKKNKMEQNASVKQELIDHLKAIPMAFLTGFIVGVTVGGIMSATMGMHGSMGGQVSLTATPPPPTIAVPPYIAGTHRHPHHDHPNDSKID